MKKNYKKGFFLSETMVVMAIVTIVIIGVFKIFSTTYTKYKETENYNTVNAVNALANVKKYFESFGEIDSDTLLNNSSYVELTNYEDFNSDLYTKIKEEYDIESIYLIDMNIITSDLNDFDVTMRKYINSLSNNNGIILLIHADGNKYTSTNIIYSNPTLVGDPDDEYITYVNKGDAFVDPGYSNWSGTPPTTTWEDELDTTKEGTYYLIYNFNNYLIRRKVVVGNFEKDFEYTGDVQEFTVSLDGYYKVELWGASGNNSYNAYVTAHPSYGGYTTGLIYLKKGEKIYVYVGGEKEIFNCCTKQGTEAGSGGATDVRLNNGSWDDAVSLRSRIMVAGGAGGTYSDGSGNVGNSAGGLISESHTGTYGMGASTQISGGAAALNGTAGTFGKSGVNSTTAYNSGGGGYYGGGSGPSGGGGSSYISGHTGCVAIQEGVTTPKTGCTTSTTDNTCSIHYSGKKFTDTLMIDGLGYTWTNVKASTVGTNLMPNPVGGTYASGVGHSGNGYARITFVEYLQMD